MNIIFLDFDGVLNRGAGEGVPSLVQHLNHITQRTGAAIVVHSSWRWGRTVDQLRAILRRWGVLGVVLDACPSPINYKTEGGIWVAKEDWNAFKGNIESNHERCIAIQRWLDDHPEIKRYVIFDDSPDLGHFVGKPEFIRTQTREGLTKDHADKAILHLKGITW